MNYNKLFFNKTDSTFLKKLKKDINSQIEIYQDSKKFIEKFNLIEYKIEDTIPSICYFGKFFLIKNNSILDFYSYINPLTNEWSCDVNIYNLNFMDIISFSNVESYRDKKEFSINYSDKLTRILNQFMKQYFKIYIKI